MLKTSDTNRQPVWTARSRLRVGNRRGRQGRGSEASGIELERHFCTEPGSLGTEGVRGGRQYLRNFPGTVRPLWTELLPCRCWTLGEEVLLLNANSWPLLLTKKTYRLPVSCYLGFVSVSVSGPWVMASYLKRGLGHGRRGADGATRESFLPRVKRQQPEVLHWARVRLAR